MLEHLVEQSLNTLISVATTAAIAGAVWLITLKWRSSKIRALLGNPERQFEFFYRGAEFKDKKKRLTFGQNGEIIEGHNPNEHTWKVAFGTLRIHNDKNQLYSKFRWDQDSGILLHTNDPKLPSVLGQYIVPLFVKPGHF